MSDNLTQKKVNVKFYTFISHTFHVYRWKFIVRALKRKFRAENFSD